MNASERPSHLRDAGSALARRPTEEVLDVLGRVLDGWSAPRSQWRESLARELPDATGFSPEVVREGLARGLEPFTGAALRELVARELGRVPASGFPSTAVILAGALPTPTFPALLAPLVLRSPVVVKTSVHDPVTAPALARSIAEVDPTLGACVEVMDFRRNEADRTAELLAADCVVASGSDETVAALAARVRPPRRFVARGHRFSVAVLGPEATSGPALARTADALAVDVALWDQLGCLSPVAVHVVDPDEKAADRVAEALAAALERAEARWPRGRVAPAAAALAAGERAEGEMRAAAGRRVAVFSSRAWTVVREADDAWRAAPLHRFVRVLPTADPWTALAPRAAHLAGVALAGFGEATRGVAQQLARLGASRVCAPGTLQTPPLGWPADNQGVLLPLARLASIE